MPARRGANELLPQDNSLTVAKQRIPDGKHGVEGQHMKAPAVEVRDVSKSYEQGVPVLRDASLTVAQGERLSLLGPSGSGKTTLLDLMAGFIFPDQGQILIGGVDQTGVGTHKRNIGIVFQNHALFPHMSIWENVAFGLRSRHIHRSEIKERVAASLEMVGLASTADRRPKQLSGGQQQRVAFARAIVLNPAVLLLDEPFASLDTALRTSMRLELIRLQEELGIPAVLVTHDQEEALAFGHSVSLLNAGRIEQTGSPEEMYEEPVSRYVANFIGAANFISGQVLSVMDSKVKVRIEGGSVLDCAIPPGGSEVSVKEDIQVLFRPHWFKARAKASTPTEPHLSGTVSRATYYGSTVEYEIEVANFSVLVRAGGGSDLLASGERIDLTWGDKIPLVLPLEAKTAP